MTMLSNCSRKFKGSLVHHCKRKLSELPITHSVLTDAVPRTSLSSSEQTPNEYGMWYTVSKDCENNVFGIHGFPQTYMPMFKVYREMSLMVRPPALEVIDYIKRANYNEYAFKYLFYGMKGVGRTFSLAHVMEYLHTNEFLLVHAGRPGTWSTSFKEILPSLKHNNMFDHTLDAVEFLQSFKNQNKNLIKKLKLKTKKKYVMNVRETIEEGDILNLVDYGIQRARYAAEVIQHLMSEVIELANNKEVKVAVVIDGINALFQNKSKFNTATDISVNPAKFTIVKAMKSLLTTKWRNGCIVGVVDMANSRKIYKESYYPRYLLLQEGWEALDPFIPVRVSNYDKNEFRSLLLYYNDRKWLQHPQTCTEQGVMELEYLSGLNPRVLYESCLFK